MKTLNLKITNCKECPYFNYDSQKEEYKCSNLDKLLFTDDYLKDSELIVFKDCPLPNTN